MELESLKYIWQCLEVAPAQEPDKAALLALLQKKSRGPVAKMRRNLLLECFVVAITYIPTILFYWIDFNSKLTAIAWMFLALMIVLGIYYYRKNGLLKQMLCTQCHVRSNLER